MVTLFRAFKTSQKLPKFCQLLDYNVVSHSDNSNQLLTNTLASRSNLLFFQLLIPVLKHFATPDYLICFSIQASVRPSQDHSGCSTLRRYYAQLQFLQSRFPLGEGEAVNVQFTWYAINPVRNTMYTCMRYMMQKIDSLYWYGLGSLDVANLLNSASSSHWF